MYLQKILDGQGTLSRRYFCSAFEAQILDMDPWLFLTGFLSILGTSLMVRAQHKLMFSFLFISDYGESEGRDQADKKRSPT